MEKEHHNWVVFKMGKSKKEDEELADDIPEGIWISFDEIDGGIEMRANVDDAAYDAFKKLDREIISIVKRVPSNVFSQKYVALKVALALYKLVSLLFRKEWAIEWHEI